jgi:hypothetical protein
LFDGYNCTILAYGQTGAGKVSLVPTPSLYFWCRFFVLTTFAFRPDIYHGHSCQGCGTD